MNDHLTRFRFRIFHLDAQDAPIPSASLVVLGADAADATATAQAVLAPWERVTLLYGPAQPHGLPFH